MGQVAAEEALRAQVVQEPGQAREVAGHGVDRMQQVGALAGGEELEAFAPQQVHAAQFLHRAVRSHPPQGPGVAGIAVGAR